VVEPVADTVGELRRNLERDGCTNVDIVQGAAAAGEVPMMMTDDPALRANRLALLRDIAGTMNRVADISKLAQ